MAENNSDDLADALARMASGDVAPSEHQPPAPVPAPPSPPPIRTARPPAARPPAPNRAPAPLAPTPPAAPPRARPAAPAIQTPAPASAPVIRPGMPVTRKARPSAPQIAPPPVTPVNVDPVEMQPGAVEGSAAEIIDDDDMMAMPAPDASVFQTRSKNTLGYARAKVAARRSLEFRRTLIPVLFTGGIMMLGFASLKLVADPDSSLVAVPVWVPALLVVGAVVFLALAVLNMLSVKQQMQAEQSK